MIIYIKNKLDTGAEEVNKRIMVNYVYTFKVLLLGDTSSGKDELINRYISSFFHEDEKLTIGVEFYSKTIDFKGKKIKLQIWDVGGEERFRFLLPTFCLGANAAFLLYDISNYKTFDHLPDRIQIIREKTGDIPILLVGNKYHLKKPREVSREEGLKMAKKYNLCGFTEISTKTGQNVDKTFETLIELTLESMKER